MIPKYKESRDKIDQIEEKTILFLELSSARCTTTIIYGAMCTVQDVPEWNLIFLSNLGLCWRCLKCQNRASLNFVWLHECRSAAQIHKFGVNSLFICCGKSYTSNTILHLDTIPFFLASCGLWGHT